MLWVTLAPTRTGRQDVCWSVKQRAVRPRVAGGVRMELFDDKVRCAVCGTVLELPLGCNPRVLIKAAGGEPTVRTIVYEGVEVHSCALASHPLSHSATT